MEKQSKMRVTIMLRTQESSMVRDLAWHEQGCSYAFYLLVSGSHNVSGWSSIQILEIGGTVCKLVLWTAKRFHRILPATSELSASRLSNLKSPVYNGSIVFGLMKSIQVSLRSSWSPCRRRYRSVAPLEPLEKQIAVPGRGLSCVLDTLYRRKQR